MMIQGIEDRVMQVTLFFCLFIEFAFPACCLFISLLVWKGLYTCQNYNFFFCY